MKNLLFFPILLLWQSAGWGQPGLEIHDEVIEVLSSKQDELKGVFSSPEFSPHSPAIFSFVRQFGDNRYLHIYNLSEKKLEEVSPVQSPENREPLAATTYVETFIYNDELDWRPVPDKQNRQWFAFVSNGSGNNHDIYIGYVGGSRYIRLTDDSAIDQSPRWSPDGKSIAFLSSRSGNGDIFLIKNLDEVINRLNASSASSEQLTNSPGEEVYISWNPDAEAGLIAYSQKMQFVNPQRETYQIRVFDVAEKTTYSITNNPDKHFTRPQWDPHHANRLIYIGQSLQRESGSSLYLSRFEWLNRSSLRWRRLEGFSQVLFKNIQLTQHPVVWLANGEVLICREDRRDQNYPVYSVHINKWLERRGKAIYYFEDLHRKYPKISGFDVRQDFLLLTVQEGNYYKALVTKLTGDAVHFPPSPEYRLSRPGKPWYLSKYTWAGAAGISIPVILLLSGAGDDGGSGNGIGPPPSMPDIE